MPRSSATLERALTDYERHRIHEKKRSLRTWAGEKPGLLQFVDHCQRNGVTVAGRVDSDLVASWWGQLELADSTKGTRLHQLRSFLRFCARMQWMEQDPSWRLAAPKVHTEEADRLDADELLRLLDAAAYPTDRITLALAMNLACRAGEIKRITVGHVDLDALTLKLIVDKTHEIDSMPISDDLAWELDRWLTHYESVVGTLSPDMPLVPGQYVSGMGGPQYKATPVGEPENAVKRALGAAGLDAEGGIHLIRRSMARLYFELIEADESTDSALLHTMTLLHHTRTETTLKYIGKNKRKEDRDRVIRGRPFLTRMAGVDADRTRALRSVV